MWLKLVFSQERFLELLLPLFNDSVDGIFERLHEHLRLLLLSDQVLLLGDPSLPGLVLLDLSVESVPGLPEHSLPPLVVLLEDLLHLGRDRQLILVFVRMLLQDRKNLARQLLVVDECLLHVRRHTLLFTTTLVSLR